MGADHAVRVESAVERFDAVNVARGLAMAISTLEADLVLTGIQSTDAAQQATGPALAAVLDWPCVAGVTSLTVIDGRVDLHRELEGGRAEVVEVNLPAVLVVQTGLNQPRYGTFKDKLRAKKADIAVVTSCNNDQTPSLTLRRIFVDGDRSENMELIEGNPEVVAARIMELVRGKA